jgi:endonuclease YncB( thermonuclease family)
MHNVIRFWQKDLINKLLILLSLALFCGVVVLTVLILNMPAGKSLAGAVGEVFPTPTLAPQVIMTRAIASAQTRSAEATASVPPTITTMPFTPFPKSPTPTLGPAALPSETATPTIFVPTPTLFPSATPTPFTPTATPVVPTPTRLVPTPTPVVKPSDLTQTATPQAPSGGGTGAACLPANPPQTGRVLDVLDASTIKVQIDGFAYVVRYIGIERPVNKNYGVLADVTNGGLVFAKDVLLISDATDKDANGRLLRYVKVGETFVNLELLQKGLATTVDVPPNFACASVFADAEQTARSAGLGIWEPTPTPRAP